MKFQDDGHVEDCDLPVYACHCTEVVKDELDKAQALLREISVANNDGEGGHEDLWDAVDAYVREIDLDG